MDDQPTLSDGRLLIRPLESADIPHLAEAANDPLIWEQHPSKDRGNKALFTSYAQTLLAVGGTVIFITQDENRIIGCSRFYKAPDDIENWSIGFTFIEREFWGKNVNSALKNLMINHIFKTHDRVWFHIDPHNIRSQRATMRLGGKKIAEIEADILNSGSLAPYFCYLITKADWASVSHET